MSHSHHHPPHPNTGNLKLAFFLNLVFTIVELIGGFMTNSVAILSDALHDFGDSLSLGLAWYFQKLSGKGRDHKYTYGYRRFSILGAIINSIILVLGSVFIILEAIPRFYNPEEVNHMGMIWLAILGIVVNGYAAYKLQRGKSVNEQVVSYHLLEDVLGWIAILVGAIVMYFYNLPWIDPCLSLLISVFIIYRVIKNLDQSLRIILQAIPGDADAKAIDVFLNNHDQINAVHDLHMWSLDGEYNVLTAHIVLKKEPSFSELDILKKKLNLGLKQLGIDHATLEFEMNDSNCELEDC